ncbi:hypothetical protein CY34DRAFT_336093 [Suillus luteus UH-Slu-Lm8-n1]|uniref:Uncharacterized protein n=1 Tax=Suillus luteus UH-Slu-Lm8-n1 TaxID=930992 RepID=A0A0D0ACN4_9AGAM|nr:hypothetical protein CY34DRAFT_336093 [Suillus luteus UH-Slu-Lm8-n1]
MLKKGQQSLEFWLQTHRSIAICNHHPDTITLVLGGQWIAGGRAANRAHPPTPEEAFSVNGRVDFMVGSGYRNRRRLDSIDVFGCFRASRIFESRSSVQNLNELLDGCLVSNINVVVLKKALNGMPRSCIDHK